MKKIIAGKEFEQFSRKVDGRDITFYRFGNGPHKLVTLPGLVSSGLYYLWVLHKYDFSGLEIITFDIPGWPGQSEGYTRRQKFLFTDYLSIARRAISELGADRFSLIGYSYGGAVAIKLAAEFKHRLQKIVLISAVVQGGTLNSSLVKLMKFAALFKLYATVKMVVLDFFNYFHYILRRDYAEAESLVEANKILLKKLDGRIVIQSSMQLLKSDFLEELEQIKDLKALVINSKGEDKMYKQQAEIIRRHLSQENSKWLTGIHENFILHPDRMVVKEMIAFLASAD